MGERKKTAILGYEMLPLFYPPHWNLSVEIFPPFIEIEKKEKFQNGSINYLICEQWKIAFTSVSYIYL